MLVYKPKKSPNIRYFGNCDKKSKGEQEVRSDPESKNESGSHQKKTAESFNPGKQMKEMRILAMITMTPRTCLKLKDATSPNKHMKLSANQVY